MNKKKEIEEAIRIVFFSFKTHLDFIVNPPKPSELKMTGNKKWNKERCKNYIKVIKVLIDSI